MKISRATTLLVGCAITCATFAAGFDDVASWTARGTREHQQFINDLRRATGAKEVASAVRAHARNGQRRTDELIQLIGVHPEMRNMPEFGLNEHDLREWRRRHPDAPKVPRELTAISQNVLRFYAQLYQKGGTAQAIPTLAKYREDPDVKAALEEWRKEMEDKRRRLLEIFR